MGRYFTPATPEAIAAAGCRPIERGPHRTMLAGLKPGESLGWHLGRSNGRKVADVTDHHQYREHAGRVGVGLEKPLGFWAVPRDVFGGRS